MSDTPIEPVGSLLRSLDYELNRLAGTLVFDRPTVGPATAAKRWLGDTEPWAAHNLLPVNVATGGSAKEDTSGFVPLHGQSLALVEGDSMVGNTYLQVTSAVPGETVYSPSAIILADKIKVEPLHIYTATAYVLAKQEPRRGARMSLIWLKDDGTELERSEGDQHASKAEWNKAWVTAPAPAGTAFVLVQLTWPEQLVTESFGTDKWGLANSSDPGWAYPERGASDVRAGLTAHLNMKAGIFDPDQFVSATEAANLIAGTSGLEIASALSTIPTPNPLVVAH